MLDELHLLLRSFDILMNNIIQHIAYQDELQGTRDPLSGPNLNLLVHGHNKVTWCSLQSVEVKENFRVRLVIPWGKPKEEATEVAAIALPSDLIK